MRLGPVRTAGAHPGSLPPQLLVHWSSAPCPAACIWSSHRGFPPCCMRNISPSPAVVLTKTSPLGSHLPTRNTHDSDRASRRGEVQNARIYLLGFSPDRNEAGISSYHLIFDRSSFCVCVCVGWSQPGILQIGKTIGTFQVGRRL